MGIAEWLRAFRVLHERARKGDLSPADLETYHAGCDELSRALLAAQRLATRPDERPLHALRVARAVQVDLETPLSRIRVPTIDLGVGGFSALLAKAPPAGEEARCTMRIPGGAPLEAAVVVTDAKQLPGSVRVSFAFRGLEVEARAAIETLVIDTALSQIDA